MRRTEQTLLEQMRITELEIDNRKTLFSITAADCERLAQIKPMIEREVDRLVHQFYDLQTSVPEIALLIGDADTLRRLRGAQRTYVIDLFSGFYDIEYVNNRLRIGMVHKRIGVEPKLYLAAIHQLKTLLNALLARLIPDATEARHMIMSVEKLFMFDISLVFDTYIRSLISEIEASKEKSECYASELEDKVKERTKQLEMMSRTDALTGLLNVRHLVETLTQCLRAAQRRLESLTVVFLDINDFKRINDEEGHQRGDEILRTVADAIRLISRTEDYCFRYGGDEFCIILPRCTEAQARQSYGKRLIAEVNRHEAGLSISGGYVQACPAEHASAEELIRVADERMYLDKQQYRQQGIVKVENQEQDEPPANPH
ncbi:MAG: diguanylate cyclase [Oceanospirillales bacterium]|nr:diguanylate cyclase [Oceanospirillales bacterium]